ncbi:hypothetical protein [Chryseobacterium luquanense]|uniref:Glycosyl hydrolase family 32 N-terminal domain-containing protein n=1 Tax=Chryseobacterium luquanense TaxID=2983766 RepID=A0ABT3Y661_9FLAO|nr:hypothetical protein [Chryseobacterium luquanense]MCX8533637.1 hypothetical protein [Chryseobacterium luquanense]
MNWEKIGAFDAQKYTKNWFQHSALQPTPIVLQNEIRVFCGFRDASGISRVGFVDLDINDPSNILRVSDNPVLDIGTPGCFDDNGVVPSAVLSLKDKIYLYYAGYQIPKNVRFLVFGGLAVSDDFGKTFTRCFNVPVLDRTQDEQLFRVAHSVLEINNEFHAFYGGGSDFDSGKDKTLPKYDIRHLKSQNHDEFPKSGNILLKCEKNEHRLGRPYVFKNKNLYEMYFGYGTEENPYWLTSAVSKDLENWQRNRERIIPKGSDMNDDKMQAYPAVFEVNETKYLLYNGNDYGKYGFIICKEI